ncbi:MAG: 4-hydroxy-3-methylbut-2-enyl diphosphate reductase [Planctomycetota bacterium]
MRVTVAKALGTCFGVQDAIELAERHAAEGDLTIIGQLVHNPQTVERLRERGVEIVDRLDPHRIRTKTVMITAHGAPRSLSEKAQDLGYRVIDASCPLVMRVHRAVAEFVEAGYHPVVIGQVEHVEVKGIVGDLADTTVIRDPSEIPKLAGKKKLGIVSQTTQQIDFVLRLVAEIRAAFPDADVRFRDTVCRPTKDRQAAVRELAREVDLMIVVGGHNSSNTKKLKLVCDELGVKAYHIERASELRPEMFEGCEHVGITAGTSTPSEVIDEVYRAILAMPGVDAAASYGPPRRETA